MTTPPDALLVIDLETTGGSPAAGAMVLEWGAALVVEGQVKQTVGTLIQPPRRRDLQTAQARAAQRVHGIGDDEVWNQGMKLAAAVDRCRTWIGRVRDRHGRVALTSYNLGFERRFLDTDPWRLTDLDEVEWGPCVLATARARLPRLTSHRLTSVATHLDLPKGRAHRAQDDAVLAARVWLALGRTLEDGA